MPAISLTDLVDIVSRSGNPKANKVAEVKNRPDYHPSLDFYRQFRLHIVETHESGGGKKDIGDVLLSLTDPKKADSYKLLTQGYAKWWGNKKLVWFTPPSGLFSDHGVDVSVNPELGLLVNGKHHLVKLYMKADAISKNRVDIITHLMSVALSARVQVGTTMSVLDVRNGKLYSPTVPIKHLNAMLSGELAYVSALWSKI